MKFLTQLFGKTAAPSAAMIAAEIDKNDAALTAIETKLSLIFDDLASMTDDEHIAANEKRDRMAREAEKLTAANAKLRLLHGGAAVAEAEAERVAAVEAQRLRVKNARKAVEGSDRLLKEYDRVAGRLAELLEDATRSIRKLRQ